ncbi:unnamed protein product [Paramecium sonneborni]|uniref:Uncharacterized protein n=1 Tax=Paramecium sonneborni TaxID=65129 RepID=A0A8S1RY46_9CILI|nr:unnamed protein product [Paramecium sonneborni]
MQKKLVFQNQNQLNMIIRFQSMKELLINQLHYIIQQIVNQPKIKQHLLQFQEKLSISCYPTKKKLLFGLDYSLHQQNIFLKVVFSMET